MKKMFKLALILVIILGIMMTLHWHVGFIYDLHLGKFPGDFSFYVGKVRIFIPVTTSILSSIFLLFVWEKIIKRH
jgi:hypothetical protein